MKLERGEHLIIVGPQASGKSQLAELIAKNSYEMESVDTIDGELTYRSSYVAIVDEFCLFGSGLQDAVELATSRASIILISNDVDSIPLLKEFKDKRFKILEIRECK